MLLPLMTTLVLAAGAPPRTIAVLNLEAASGVPAQISESATLLLPTEVRRNAKDATVVSGKEIAAMIGFERQKQLLGCKEEEASCLAELGGALGAAELVSGTIGQLGTRYVLEIRRIEVRTSRTLGSVSMTLASPEALIDAVKTAARELYPPPAASLASYAWAPAAGGGVLALAGGFFLMQAAQADEVLRSATGPTDGRTGQQVFDDGVRARTLGWAGVGLGTAGLAAAGAMLLFGNAPAAPPVRAALAPTGSGFALVIGGDL